MSFKSLDLPDYLLKAVDELSYEKPTPVQAKTIPLILEEEDVVVRAQTGTGKTASFAIPIIKMINDLPAKKKKISVLSLVLVPTRELAIQVAAAFKGLSQFSPRKVKTISLIGGESLKDQIYGLRTGMDVVIATPGRLLELVTKNEIRLVELEMFIMDEADKLLNLGFIEEINALLEKLPKIRQNMLFSATMPEKVLKLVDTIFDNPVRVEIEAEQPVVDAIEQRVIQVDVDNRRPLLQHLLKTSDWEQTMVFVASKKSARNLAAKLTRDGFSAAALHGDLEQQERFQVLKDFRKKKSAILVATDIACRGIDIEKLSCVINYDLPRSPLDYVHRIGRTGRAGESGIAISFVDHETEAHFRVIENKSSIRIKRETVEGFELTGEKPQRLKGSAPVKGKRKSKKDKLREQQALEEKSSDSEE